MYLHLTAFFIGFIVLFGPSMAWAKEISLPLDKTDGLQTSRITMEESQFKGVKALKVAMTREAMQEGIADAPNLAWLDIPFHNGSIEVEVASAIMKDAPEGARGFIGLGFRIGKDMQFEGIYLRPTNGRADDQIRRNHSTQYFSYPDYPFSRLRQESPEKYESYTDLVLGEWTKMRVEVEGEKARLYVNDAPQPCLIVNDLKLGPDARGGVGLFVDAGTDGYFRNLKITQK